MGQRKFEIATKIASRNGDGLEPKGQYGLHDGGSHSRACCGRRCNREPNYSQKNDFGGIALANLLIRIISKLD
jgi:hypothetical protein